MAHSNSDLMRFKRLATGCELRIVEAKREVSELLEWAGAAVLYDMSLLWS